MVVEVVHVVVLVVAHEVGLVVDHVVAVSTNHKDLNHLILITQKTTIMELKNETKSSGTKRAKSSASKKVILLIGKKVEVALEAGALIEVVVAQSEEVIEVVAVAVVVAAGSRTVQSKHLHLTQRTVTSK